jgi:hypothetical protein
MPLAGFETSVWCSSSLRLLKAIYSDCYLLTVLHIYVFIYYRFKSQRTNSIELMVPQLVEKFNAFYGPGRPITVFTKCRYLSLSWAILIQSTPSHSISFRYILILSSHLRHTALNSANKSFFYTCNNLHPYQNLYSKQRTAMNIFLIKKSPN